MTPWHLALALPLFAVGVGIHGPVRDNSFLWHVTAGRLQAAEGAVLTADPFSFTRLGQPWRTQSWLAELLYSFLDERVNLQFVPWMVWVVSAVYLVAMSLIAYRVTKSLAATCAFGVLTVIVSIAFLNPRPVIFSFALFALLVLAEGDRRLRWSVPILIWVWASVHGSFAIGGVYLLLQAIRRRRWSAWKEIAASVVAATLTAHGIGAWLTLFDFARSREALDLITEWATPDLISIPMAPLFAGIGLLIWAGIRGRIAGRDLIVVIPFLALALSANRSVVPGWIGLAPFVALALSDLRFGRRDVRAPAAILNGALMAALVVGPLAVPMNGSLDEEYFPVRASSHLISDRVFHDDSTGGYLIYAEWPARSVFIDDRAELYGRPFFDDFGTARAGRPGWDEVLADHGVTEILLPSEQSLVETARLSGWLEVAEIDGFTVMRSPELGGG